MADIINLSPIEEEKSIPELLRKLADDIDAGVFPPVRGATVAIQSEIEDGQFAFDVFGWGEWVRSRADVYWSLMKAGSFVL